MPKIIPISDLRNYNAIIQDVVKGDPVYVTKNGRGKYVIMDIDEYEEMKAEFDKIKEQFVNKDNTHLT